MQQLRPAQGSQSAAEKRILLNLSTQEREAAEFNGSDSNEKHHPAQREVCRMRRVYRDGRASRERNDAPEIQNAPPEGDEEADNERRKHMNEGSDK